MDRKLFLQSLNETKKEYSKIRKDRRNTPNEFKWLHEGMDGKRVLSEKEEPTFMQQAAATLLPTSWAQATGLFDSPKSADSPEAKAARERLRKAEEEARKAAEQQAAEFVGPPAPEQPEQPEPETTSTTVAASAPNLERQEGTKDLDTFDPKDFEHNLKVYERAGKRFNDMVSSGQMSREQAVSALDEFQKRMESFVKDEKQREQFAAVRSGIKMGMEFTGPIGAVGSAIETGISKALYGDEIDATSELVQAGIGAAGGVIGKGLGVAAKGVGKVAQAAAPQATAAAQAGVQAAKETAMQALAKVAGQKAAERIAAGMAQGSASAAVAGGLGTYMAIGDNPNLSTAEKLALTLGGSVVAGKLGGALNQLNPGFLGKTVPLPKTVNIPGISIPGLGPKVPKTSTGRTNPPAPKAPKDVRQNDRQTRRNIKDIAREIGRMRPRDGSTIGDVDFPAGKSRGGIHWSPAEKIKQKLRTAVVAASILGLNPTVPAVGPGMARGQGIAHVDVDVPAAPRTPTAPSAPALPAAPRTPTAPSAPALPAAPRTPTAPSAPALPGKPAPSTPVAPRTPTAPSAPTLPGVPSTPTAPSAPTLPGVPSTSTSTAPTAPTAPKVTTPTTTPSTATVPSTPKADVPTVPKTIVPTTPQQNKGADGDTGGGKGGGGGGVRGGGGGVRGKTDTRRPPPPPPTKRDPKPMINPSPESSLDLMYGRLGMFEPGEAAAYTKSVQPRGGSDGGDPRDRFTYDRMFRIDPERAINFRIPTTSQNKAMVESIQFKNRIKTSVEKYLKSKEGHELNKHIESLKRSLD